MDKILMGDDNKYNKYQTETFIPEDIVVRGVNPVEYKDSNGSYWKCISCNGKKNFSFPDKCHECIRLNQSKFLCVKCNRFDESHRVFSTGEIICQACYQECYGPHAIVISIQELSDKISDLLIELRSKSVSLP